MWSNLLPKRCIINGELSKRVLRIFLLLGKRNVASRNLIPPDLIPRGICGLSGACICYFVGLKKEAVVK